MARRFLPTLLAGAALVVGLGLTEARSAEWVSLFNGTDLSGWTAPEGDNNPWAVADGTINCDPKRATGGKPDVLWSEKEYGDFVLELDWRLNGNPGPPYSQPIILPSGDHLKDAKGGDITIERPGGDSGVYVRGSSKSQVNIWNWPVGSGEVYGYRTDKSQPAAVRAGVTPRLNADKPVGEWNHFVITMVGDRLTVLLNDKMVLENAELPAVPQKGKVALQFHGSYNNGEYGPATSLVSFRNIRIKELN